MRGVKRGSKSYYPKIRIAKSQNMNLLILGFLCKKRGVKGVQIPKLIAKSKKSQLLLANPTISK